MRPASRVSILAIVVLAAACATAAPAWADPAPLDARYGPSYEAPPPAERTAYRADLPANACVERCRPNCWRFHVQAGIWVPEVDGDPTFNGIDFEDLKAFKDIFDVETVEDGADLYLHWSLIAEYGRFWFSVTGSTAPLYTDMEISLFGIPVAGAKRRIDMYQANLGATLYKRALDARGCNCFRADAYLGVRVQGVGAELTTILGGLIDTSEWWADPLVGGLATLELGDHFSLEAQADIGGFGLVSDYTFSLRASVEWRPWRTLGLHVGWFLLDGRYETGTGGDKFVWDTTMHGPYFAIVVHM